MNKKKMSYANGSRESGGIRAIIIHKGAAYDAQFAVLIPSRINLPRFFESEDFLSIYTSAWGGFFRFWARNRLDIWGNWTDDWGGFSETMWGKISEIRCVPWQCQIVFGKKLFLWWMNLDVQLLIGLEKIQFSNVFEYSSADISNWK